MGVKLYQEYYEMVLGEDGKRNHGIGRKRVRRVGARMVQERSRDRQMNEERKANVISVS